MILPGRFIFMNKHLLCALPRLSRGVGTGIGKPQLCLLRRLAFQCHLSHDPRVLHTPRHHRAWNPLTASTAEERWELTHGMAGHPSGHAPGHGKSRMARARPTRPTPCCWQRQYPRASSGHHGISQNPEGDTPVSQALLDVQCSRTKWEHFLLS